jgi:hypothetical protein
VQVVLEAIAQVRAHLVEAAGELGAGLGHLVEIGAQLAVGDQACELALARGGLGIAPGVGRQ